MVYACGMLEDRLRKRKYETKMQDRNKRGIPRKTCNDGIKEETEKKWE